MGYGVSKRPENLRLGRMAAMVTLVYARTGMTDEFATQLGALDRLV